MSIYKKTGLIRRNYTFYLRIPIPKDLILVALKKEFRYSLHTSDYDKAIQLYVKESAFINKIINFLRLRNQKTSLRTFFMSQAMRLFVESQAMLERSNKT